MFVCFDMNGNKLQSGRAPSSDDHVSEDRGPSLALDVDAGRLSGSEQKTGFYLSVVKSKIRKVF